MALNWEDDPSPVFHPTKPTTIAMTRNQQLRDLAASIGQPFPVFFNDEDEQHPDGL